MNVRVQLTVNVSDEDRRMIAVHTDKAEGKRFGGNRLATIAEIREFYRNYGVDVGRQVIDANRHIQETKRHEEHLSERGVA